MTNYPTEPQVEISWQATMPASLTKFCEFVESVVFSDNHYTSLRTGIKYRKDVKAIMEYQLVKEDLDAIQELLEKEVMPTRAVVDSAADPGSGTHSRNTCLRRSSIAI